MKYVPLVVALAVISATPAFNQTTDAVPATSAATAYVYVQTTPGVMVYAANQFGGLSLVKGSPFKVIGQMEDIGGKFLISVGNTILRTYQIESNGAVGKQISQTNTASFGGSECGTTSGGGSVLDHTGKYLYVQLNTLDQCDAFQTYIVKSSGELQFLGDTVSNSYDSLGNTISSTNLTVSSNDKFDYGVFPKNPFSSDCEVSGEHCPVLSGWTTTAWCRCSPKGVLGPSYAGDAMEQAPIAPSGWQYLVNPLSYPQADPYGNLAVLMNQFDGHGHESEPPQLASFSINPSNGLVSSNNSYHNMPNVAVGQNGNITMGMSPSGNLLAVVGHPGLQMFLFNGAAPPTNFGPVLLPGVNIDQVRWDNNNHLYAVSYESAQLFEFYITPDIINEPPGSVYDLPKYPYGTRGLVVAK